MGSSSWVLKEFNLPPGAGDKVNTEYLARLQKFPNLKGAILCFTIKNTQVIMVCHNVCLLTVRGFGPLSESLGKGNNLPHAFSCEAFFPCKNFNLPELLLILKNKTR